MSADTDPFATEAVPPGFPPAADDPFADTPPAADEIAAEAPTADAPAGDIPVVDREGAPVAPGPLDALVGEQAPPPAEEPPAAPEAPAAPSEVPEAPAEPPVAPEAPAEAPVPHQEPPATPATQPTTTEGAESAPGPEEAAAAAAAATAPADTPPADAPKAKAKGEMRHYKVLYRTGPTTWEEHPLTDVPQGVSVVEVEGEKWIEARNNDHATRIAFAVLGSPQEGAEVWPAPRGAFKPKKVNPAPPAPERTRLVIS